MRRAREAHYLYEGRSLFHQITTLGSLVVGGSRGTVRCETRCLSFWIRLPISLFVCAHDVGRRDGFSAQLAAHRLYAAHGYTYTHHISRVGLVGGLEDSVVSLLRFSSMHPGSSLMTLWIARVRCTPFLERKKGVATSCNSFAESRARGASCPGGWGRGSGTGTCKVTGAPCLCNLKSRTTVPSARRDSGCWAL